MTDKVQLAKEGIEAFSAGDWERFKAPLRADAVYEELATQRKVQGINDLLGAWRGWAEAFPDSKATFNTVATSGNTRCVFHREPLARILSRAHTAIEFKVTLRFH